MSGSRTIKTKVTVHCSHCGDVMPIVMDKTINVDRHTHWLVTPCECLSAAPQPIVNVGTPGHVDYQKPDWEQWYKSLETDVYRLTEDWDCHPDWWDQVCDCKECRAGG